MTENCSRCGTKPTIGASDSGWDGRNRVWVWFFECPTCRRLGPSSRTGGGAEAYWNSRQKITAEAYQSNPPSGDAATEQPK